MSQDQEALAWRLFTYNWVALGLMALALALAMALTGFSIRPSSMLLPLGMCAAYVGVAYYNAHRRYKRDPLVMFILGSTGQILLIPMLMTPMTYIAASADLPLRDASLAALDHALYLDWVGYYTLMCSHHWVVVASVLGYSMIGWPVFGVPVVLGATRRYRRLQEFTLAFALALIVTTVISALVPAVGHYDEHYFAGGNAAFSSDAYLDHLRDFPHVRDGSLRALDLTQITGIVTFPSFHAAVAVIYLWALWAVWWMRPIALLANGAMLIATPLIGGHYFVDVFAGIAVAVIAIMAAQRIAVWLAQPAAQPADSGYAPGPAIPAE